MKRNIICINCPMGCEITVEVNDDDIKISGNMCSRGENYARNEIKDPKRIITTTIKVNGGLRPLVSAKTDREISKKLIFKVMDEINRITVNSPVKVGDILINNVLGTDVNIVATSNA